MGPYQPLTKQRINWVEASITLATHHLIATPQCIPLGPNMVKCHVVDVHMTPLRESQHTSHQNIERIPNSHDY